MIKKNVVTESTINLADFMDTKIDNVKTGKNILVVGDQGTWKTGSAKTIPPKIIAPRTGELVDTKALYIDADIRSEILPKDKLPWIKFMYMPYNPFDVVKMYRAHVELINCLMSAKLSGSAEWNYNVGIYDSLTPLNLTIFDLSYLDPPNGVGGDAYSTEYKGAERNYGFMKVELRKILFGFMSAFDYFVLIAHEKEPFWGERDVTQRKYSADVVGGLKDILPKLFSEVYYTKFNDGKWMWLTQPLGQRFARSCLPLPPIVPQDYAIPMAGKWKDYVKGGENEY